MYPSLSDSKEHRIEGLFYTHISPLVYDIFELKQYKTEVQPSYSGHCVKILLAANE